jgi:competence protein ComEC
MLAGAVGAVSYWAISGMQIAASRACFMALWWIVGRWLGRPSDGLWSIGWAAIVILAVQPEALVHPSFHMSFAAVACLMGVRPPMIARPWLRVPAHWFWASLLAGLATAPFAMYHFHVQYLSGLLANMAATPLTSFCLMPAVVAIFLLWPLGLESFGLEVLGLGVDGLLWISGVSAVSSWSLHWPTMPLASLLWITVGLLACLVWQRPRWRWLGAVAMGVGAWIAIMSPVPDMLIDGLGQRFAVRDFGTGRWIYSHRGGSRFTRKQWDALAMVPGEALASEVSSLVLEKLQEGCWRYHHPRRTVAIATHEDCPRAEVSVHLDSRSWLRMEKAALRIRKDGEIEWIPVIHPASDRPWDPVVEMGRKDAGLQQKDDSKSIWGLHLG